MIIPFPIPIPSCFRYQGNLDYCVMPRSLKAKVSGHSSVACMVGKMETKGIKITESDETISCEARERSSTYPSGTLPTHVHPLTHVHFLKFVYLTTILTCQSGDKMECLCPLKRYFFYHWLKPVTKILQCHYATNSGQVIIKLRFRDIVQPWRNRKPC